MTAENGIFADLHTHSSASDGVLSPAELIRACREAGLGAVALTDHDTVSGLLEAERVAVNLGIELIHGIEVSCGWVDCDYSLHILGLFINPRASCLTDKLAEQQKARHKRALKILDLLEIQGIPVAPLRAQFKLETEKVLGRPHIARYLQKIGAIGDFQEAFEKYLKRGASAYVPKLQVLPEESIDMIHRAGGLAIIAHPGLKTDWPKLWEKISSLSWDGIESDYSEHTPEQIQMFRSLAKDLGWQISGGSDYHGEYGKHVNRLGGAGLTEDAYHSLARAAREIRELRVAAGVTNV
ncbi:MAG: PHP domain-containing protein [Candidatus Riflebacteria bacterium]|nr:PHP domain-containing protein [Candidatus Riflebacteria bacterium]